MDWPIIFLLIALGVFIVLPGLISITVIPPIIFDVITARKKPEKWSREHPSSSNPGIVEMWGESLRFREKYKDGRPIIVSESGVKADYGVHDPRGKAQYTEDFQAEYTRLMLEEVFANRDIGGIAIWQFTDSKTYTRVTPGMRNRSYGVNTGGLFDLYRRPKMAVEAVREMFSRKTN